jgi:hypothetical protein
MVFKENISFLDLSIIHFMPSVNDKKDLFATATD